MAADRIGAVGEVIVVDAKSRDRTWNVAFRYGARVIGHAARGRAIQMNRGAAVAEGSILYFLHADTLPPYDFTSDILRAVDEGASSGCFRLAFDSSHWLLSASAWCTRININAVRFGDQSLFVTRDAFQESGGFDEGMKLLEDQEIVSRLRRQGSFVVLPQSVITSARRYVANGTVRLQAINTGIYFLYRCGVSQQFLARFYRRLILPANIPQQSTSKISTNRGQQLL
jgi:rSAM/selenodomain-associated transferase 2